jgi:lipoprotein
MIKQNNSLKHGLLRKAISIGFLLTFCVIGVACSKQSSTVDNNAVVPESLKAQKEEQGNLTKEEYQTLREALVKNGLYINKDDTIGGVFNLSDGSTMRVYRLDGDGNLWGVVKVGENQEKIAVFDYASVLTFIERKESVSVK